MIIRDNFCQFCIKTYVVTSHLNRLDETVQRGVTAYGLKRKKEKLSLNYHQILLLSIELWSQVRQMPPLSLRKQE